MPWLELSLVVHAEQQPSAEEALDELGALSITLQDADAETPDEQAIFEPGVGELPLWPTITLNALFDAGTDRRGLIETLGELLSWLEPAQVVFRDVADQDWERAWMDQFKPMAFGRRLWIYPWNIEPPEDDQLVAVRLDPGLAFGSGTHPTTALCLEWLDGLALDGCHVIDYGCGSGILAIAALKLGATSAVGIDNDPQALIASSDNAQRNGVGDQLAMFLPEDAVAANTAADSAPTALAPPCAAAAPARPASAALAHPCAAAAPARPASAALAHPCAAPADVLVANILAGPLGALAPTFASLAKPGAPFAISGILAGQQDELLQRYGEWFEALRVDMREDWVRISGRRRA